MHLREPNLLGDGADKEGCPIRSIFRSVLQFCLPLGHKNNPISWWFRGIGRFLVGFAIILIVSIIARSVTIPNALEIDVQSPPQNDIYQIFLDTGRGFNQEESMFAGITASTGTVTVTFTNVPFQDLKNLRIDPGIKAGNISIQSITLLHQSRMLKLRVPLLRWTGDSLLNNFTPMHHISDFSMSDSMLLMTAIGDDPQFTIKGGMGQVHTDIEQERARIRRCLYGVSFVVALCLFVFYRKCVEVTPLWVDRICSIQTVMANRMERMGISSGFRHHTWIILAYGALSLLFFNRIFFGYLYDHTSFLSIWHPWKEVIQGGYLINPVLSDQTDAMIPRIIKFFVHRSWWQPEAAFGLPVFALLGGLFFPLRAVFLLFEAQTAITIAYLLSTTLAGYAMFVFLRDYKISKHIAFIGGMMYMFSPRLIVSIGTTIGGHILPFLPFYFLAIKKVVRSQCAGKLLVFSVVSAILILSGFPSIVAFVIYMGFLYFVSLILSDYREAQRNCLPIYAFGTLCGFLLSAFVLLQTSEMVSAIADISYRTDFWRRSVPAVFGFHFLNPYFFENRILESGAAPTNLIENGVYSGLFTWLFLLPGLYLMMKHRDREFYFFPVAIMVTVAIIFNFGHVKSVLRFLPIFDNHPATRMSFILPFFLIPPCINALERSTGARATDKPSRACFRLALSSILLFVTASIYLYNTYDIRSISYYVTFSTITFMLAVTALLAAYKGKLLAAIFKQRKIYAPCLFIVTILATIWMFPLSSGAHPPISSWLNCLLDHYAWSLVWLCGFGVFFLLCCTIKKPSRLPIALLMMVIFVDLYLFGGFYNTPTKRETFYPTNPTTTFLQKNMEANERILPIDRSFLPNCNIPYAVNSVQARGLTSMGYKQLMQQIDSAYLAGRGTASYFRYNLDIGSPLLDWFNVKYLLADDEFDLEHARVINQFHHNSMVSLCRDNPAIQTFMLEQDSRIDRLEIMCSQRIVAPLEIEVSVWDENGRVVDDRLTLTPDHSAFGWIGTPLPVEVIGGNVYHMQLQPLRALDPAEAVHVFAVEGCDVFPDGELVSCPEHEDLAFRLVAEREASDQLRYRKVYDGAISIYENLGAERRGIFPVERIAFISDSDAYISAIKEDAYFRTAYLHESDRQHFDQTTFSSAEDDIFEYIQYDDSQIQIRVRAQSDRFIKIPDTFYPGWTASINGEPVHIYRTDLMFRGLKLPAGEYVLEFQYAPRSVFYGGLIALLTLLVLVCIECGLAISSRGHKKRMNSLC